MAPAAGDAGEDRGYRGRFAPSPTGPLHLGSLYCATYSWLEARHHRGSWLLRIEDIDPPREVAGASASILRALEAHALYWDGPVHYQRDRIEAYREARDTLLATGQAFYCVCTRRQLQEAGGIYPGTCRDQFWTADDDAAIRFRAADAAIEFTDALRGPQRFAAGAHGDFVIWRKDDLPAYQLAVVVDDAWQAISHVVRGADLLDSTPAQLQLQQALGFAHPHYLHHPLLHHNGDKLSKQTGARAVDTARASDNLARVLQLIGLPLADESRGEPPASLLRWALSHWPPAKPALDREVAD